VNSWEHNSARNGNKEAPLLEFLLLGLDDILFCVYRDVCFIWMLLSLNAILWARS